MKNLVKGLQLNGSGGIRSDLFSVKVTLYSTQYKLSAANSTEGSPNFQAWHTIRVKQ